MANATETVRVSLPTEVIKQYEDQAKSKGGNPAEWLMAERLRTFVAVQSTKPITIDDSSRQKIEALLGWNISSAEDLVKRLSVAMSVRVEHLEIPIKPNLLQRLKSRAIGVDFDTFLPTLIHKLLEEYAGMR